MPDKPEEPDVIYGQFDDGQGQKKEARGGQGCLVLLWLAGLLMLAACAGWVVQIWQRVL
jgi:hypothetical protein